MVDEIELLALELEEILSSATSHWQSDERLIHFVLAHFCKPNESKILRCVISRISMETILHRAVQSEYSDTYLFILARVSKLPEFNGVILRRMELWKFVHEIALHSAYDSVLFPTIYNLLCVHCQIFKVNILNLSRKE